MEHLTDASALEVLSLDCSVSLLPVRQPDLMVTNGAGVRAGITGVIYRQTDNTVRVGYEVSDPTGTNTTTFVIQRSLDLNSWADASSTVDVVGSISDGEFSEFATNTTQFYRMRLINFQ